ncbi:MAG: arabinose 5-phosphate isomerase [Chitinophagaceae bacterium]|nr:arabinose 5-phosphate isomerase [Chitinophagaceae bacterium]
MLKFIFGVMKHPVIKEAQKTIEIEAKAISNLQAFIDETFVTVIELINKCAGRLVVSGIGKSAIVGQKIVATLNSTGTPSLFMHAADAIHGDLGMIQEEDIVLIISKSGESPEIKVLVPLIKSFSNKVIGMVGDMNSYLARTADFVINTTVQQEACPNNLAPTSSTTAQTVMGDVLAVCLMQLNNFTGSDFAKIHPGGNLGKRLYLKVNDLFRDNPAPAVKHSATLKEAIISISGGRLGATAIINEEAVVSGIITDGDVRRLLETVENINGIDVSSLYTSAPKTITAETLAVQALEKMKEHDISQLIVTDNSGKYLGMIHLHNLIKEGII